MIQLLIDGARSYGASMSWRFKITDSQFDELNFPAAPTLVLSAQESGSSPSLELVLAAID